MAAETGRTGRTWALTSARAEVISIRKLASWPGCHRRGYISSYLDAALGELRAAGWLTQLHAGGYPSAVNLHPGDDWPDTAHVAAGQVRVAAVLDRIASDAGELARARRAGELTIAAVLPGRRAERRRRLAGPDLEFRTFCRTKRMLSSTRAQVERARDAWQAGRYRRGEDRAAARLHRQRIPRALTNPTETLKRSIVVQETGRRSGADARLLPAPNLRRSQLTCRHSANTLN